MPERVASDLIWHYTSSAGVLGMLQSRGLWVSSVKSMNDSGEVTHGFEFMETRWIRTKDLYRHHELIESIVRSGGDSIQDDLFVACASTIGDSLSQFRAYGSYAVGINVGVPLRAARKREDVDTRIVTTSDLEADTALNNGWRPVLYTEVQKADLVDRFFRYLDGKGDAWPKADDGTDAASYEASVATSQFVAVAAHLKHEAFADEREVRLFAQMSLTNPAVEVRDGRLGLTPFLIAQPDPGVDNAQPFQTMMNAARIGPGTIDAAAALDGLKMALKKFGLSISAEALEIPLR